MNGKWILGVLPVLLLLALPLWLRPRENHATPSGGGEMKTDRLVIVSAHNESVKSEYALAFRKYYQARYQRDVELDFRSPGGTSDIVRFIADRYSAEFRKRFEEDPANGEFDAEIAMAFANPKCDDPKQKFSDRQRRARKLFLESDIGIGIDLMAGGGTYDQGRQAARGFAVDGGVQKRHPEYFLPSVIPQRFGGDLIYDAKGRYYGVVLSSFGIACNLDRVRELSGRTHWRPTRWRDLGEGMFFQTLVVADPSKSGSANKCFEVILQQCMAQDGGPEKGWESGMTLIKRIIGNARSITDSAGKVVRDVGSGEAAAGMAIDTYGFTEQAWNLQRFPGKNAHFSYIPPEGGTAISADPIQMLRGAPNRQTAERFMDFLLSKDGQALHIFRPGTPHGPEKVALQRPPVRRDMYVPENAPYWSAIVTYNPYEAGKTFVYRPEWTAPYYNLLRILIRSVMLQPEKELRNAWKAILDAGGPEKVPEAYREFCRLPFAYAEAAEVNARLAAGYASGGIGAAEMTRHWSEFARDSYLRAEQLAKAGR